MNDSSDPASAPVRKYSKSSAFYFGTKAAFVSDNDGLRAKAERQNGYYVVQPRRVGCKLCRTPLGHKIDLHQHGVPYKFCVSCGHLNGAHEDTKAFVENLYIDESGEDYAKNYLDENFSKRTADIYVPKVKFLAENVPVGCRSLLDVGCGSGYFVLAALQEGFDALGVDVGRSMVDFGNAQIRHLAGTSPLQPCGEEGFFQIVEETQADIVSTIGVIEHLREPHKFFEAFSRSRAQYLYYSVPMFSMSVLFENVFPDVFPRQLSGGHTHLFTESSVLRMHEMIGMRSVAEWRFGTDILDLYRSMQIELQRSGVSDTVLQQLGDGFGSQVDQIQNVLDTHHFCSEIHIVGRKCHP